jgi:hypothetical protein
MVGSDIAQSVEFVRSSINAIVEGPYPDLRLPVDNLVPPAELYHACLDLRSSRKNFPFSVHQQLDHPSWSVEHLVSPGQ